jgi:hypothetical protein
MSCVCRFSYKWKHASFLWQLLVEYNKIYKIPDSSYRRGLFTPCTCSFCTLFVLWFYSVNMTYWKPGDCMGTLEYWPCMPCIIGVVMIRRLLLYTIQQLLCSPNSSSWCSPPLQASITKQIMAPLPCTLLLISWSRLRPGLTFRICGVSSSTADKLYLMYRQNYSECIIEWFTHLAKTT